ncbi:MAG: copper-transporting ATPase [Fimbriimonadales bacterium]|nr:MAG: copper-transporting ATPase [Fimbriimonadales bacterium]
MPTQRLKIKGMTCAACVRRVEKVLQRAPGVQQAIVNLATETAEIEVAQPVEVSALIDAVRKAGYDAEPLTSEPPASDGTAQGLKLRLLISLALTIPIVIISMLLPHPLPYQGWILLALTIPVQFGVALPLYRSAWAALRHGSANMEVLVLLGTLAAFFYSLALTLQGQAHHLYYETSAVIIALVLLGRTLEARARGQARRALESLWKLLPRETLRWNGVAYEPVALEQVRVGDRLLVRTGDRVAVDGMVLEGRGWVDESPLTGESLPQERTVGDRVLGGALLTDGMLHIQAQAVGAATMLAQVAHTVAQAQAQKASIQRLADRVAAVFVPIVVAIALLTLGGWYLATRDFATALVPAVSVLVIACPCALGLAVPIAMMTGATRAARAGVLIRGFEALERVRHIDTLVLDKTGTLTLGTPRLAHIITDGVSEQEALRLAAGLEQAVRHPLAEAILQAAQEQEIETAQVSAVEVVAGGGVRGRRGNSLLIIGSPRFLQEQGIEPDKALLAPVLLAVDGRVVAGFEFVDAPLPEVAETLHALRSAALRLVLCSGDRAEAVATFAQQVGIEEWYAAQLPADKAALVQRLKAEGRRVAFVGDGINDAPALAQADLGVAVATGTQLAAENADLLLLNRDLRTLLHALQIARAIYRVIRQNLFFAFVYNTLGIPLAAMGYLNPMLAALAMSLSSVSVVGNALRLLRAPIPRLL